MKYGACSWTFGEEPLADTAARLASFGFDGLELLGDLGRYEPGHVRRVLSDHGLAVLSLTPENVDLAHPDPALRTAAVDYYCRLLDFAAALGNPVVCCHGAVGRVRAVATYTEEWGYYVEGVRSVGGRKPYTINWPSSPDWLSPSFWPPARLPIGSRSSRAS